MKTTITTRFRCSSPLTDLNELTLMFLTLILQYLNKLVESKVGDLTSPQAFHTVKVQRFNRNRIKLLTKFRGELPMKIFALVRDLPIESCEVSHTSPPVIRTFLLTAQCLVERPKFLQGLFQRLWVLFLFTRAQCQVCVFHPKVCPNALTCCRQGFRVGVGCCYAKPIDTTGITLYRDTTDPVSVPLSVFVKSIRDFIKLPFACLRIPLTEGEGDTIVFQRPPRCSRKGDRFELVSLFDFRPATEFLEKSIVCQMDTSEFLLNRLAWQRIPMSVRGFLKVREVIAHCRITRIRQPVLIPLTLPFMEVFMHLPHIVKQVTNADCVRLFSKRIFIGFHGVPSIKSLTPNEWVGRHVTKRLRSLCLPT